MTRYEYGGLDRNERFRRFAASREPFLVLNRTEARRRRQHRRSDR
jgi:hypothetical protein